jgi:hypothetical protein
VADPDGDNAERAFWARWAVEAYWIQSCPKEGSLEAVISDLLASLAHLCDRFGLELHAILREAEALYNNETYIDADHPAEAGEVEGAQFNRIVVQS